MGCCGPSTCFTWKDTPKSRDACMCGCGYFNGMWALFTAQLFTFLGAILSLATLGDCSFAAIDPTSFELSSSENNDGSLSTFTKESRGVGFITFELSDGHCYWYDGGNVVDSQLTTLEAYWNILGDEWLIGLVLTWVCAIFAWYFFLYTLSFCCSSQVKCCRYTNGFCLAFVLVVVQACTFIVYGSKFCTENNCSFSRGAGYSIGAIVCYLIAGLAFFLSKDYPGDLYNNDDDEVQDVTKGIVYHEDIELNPTELSEARRISQQLGGTTTTGEGEGAKLLTPPEAEYDNHYNEKKESWVTQDFTTPPAVAAATTANNYNDDNYEKELSEEYVPVTHSSTAEPLERPIDVVESDKHPDVDAQY